MKIIQLFLIASAFISCGNADQTSDRTENSQEEVQAQVVNINQTDFQAKMQEENVIVIDVRTPNEVSQGYIKGADEFIDINGAEFEATINALDKDKTYLMYCRSGARSGRAGNYMVQHGFANVYNLSGGIMNYSGEVTR